MSSVATVSKRPEKPVLIYDADCQFCRRWVERWRQTTGDEVEYLGLQEPSLGSRFPETLRSELLESVHLVQPDGQVFCGAEAVFRCLATRRKWPLRIYQESPFFATVSERLYRFVASHRTFFSRLTRLLWGEHAERPNYVAVRWLFIRLIALIYFFAFTSLWIQIPGLYGKSGILPISALMERLGMEAGNMGPLARFFAAPTLFWLSTSDTFVNCLCGAGAALALLAFIGISPAFCLGGLWLLYLSFCTVGQEFLGFQWDALLLETGFLAIFFAPVRAWPNPRREQAPSMVVLWLFRWLLFRLMFWSGMAKLESGDENWRRLTALKFHYETQPLPTWIGWYAHQLPDWFQRFSVAAMFAIQLGVPFLIFLPRRVRQWACWCFISLELLIGLTGNYCFFNLLSISLCLLLLDDFTVLKWIPSRWRGYFFGTWRPGPQGYAPSSGTCAAILRNMRRIMVGFVALLVGFVSLIYLTRILNVPFSWPAPLARLYTAIVPFQSINSYGLFAMMTTTRLEIVIEGSNDRENWKPYEFKYKPGQLNRRPVFVEPHQPRLDWQMWFAALGSYRSNPWFLRSCARLLEGSPEVTDLLEKNPFPETPPKYLRARVYEYHFTNIREKAETGNWWKREEKGFYLPVVTEESFRRE